mgnify:FL=1
MQLNQRLNIKHSQSIVMTPQLRQAIKLLQFSNLELSSYIEEEIEKNPFLENKKNDILARSDNSKLQKINNNESFADDNDKDNQRWEEKFHNKQRGNSFDDISSLEDRIAEPKKNLRTHLMEQILLDIPEGLERKVAILLLDLIEPSGWIKLDIDEFVIKNNIQKEYILKVLEKLQKLEPTGVFSRNLGECLRLQLKEKGLFNESIEIITNNLEYLAKGEIQKLCKLAKVNEEKLSEYVNTIKRLNPKPAITFSDDDFRIDPPDVVIEKTKKGWKVELNKSTLPAIKIEEGLAEKVKCDIKKNENDKKFVSEAFNSAKWLLRAIEQRNSTTLKVAVEILKKQKEFFKNGPGHLKPLVLRNVASSIGMHESTVSRVTRSKLLQTPWGLFQMKDFFSSSVGPNENEEAHSAKTVRTLLKDIISTEKSNRPYSDEKLSLLFKERGVFVARRTVAKYREMLKIPSSAERKRLMRLNKVINIKN